MGEVYQARDTRLHRDVALKMLPTSVAANPDRLARFEREAQILAALNHPNIAAIYGVEEQHGTAALVLELVEGPTLADRISQGPMPLDEAVTVALQIAEALEAAHEQGIVHRDLKPANIKLRSDGTVKVLDFGLAKTVIASAESTAPAVNAADSPTLTAAGTAVGVVLGTAFYMAPEQARGRAVDRRADIWAFGVVLFEMLTRRRPFGGDTVSETLAAVIKDPPAWSGLPRGLPVRLQELLRRTLEKDPRRRLRDIGDARLVLEELKAGRSATSDERTDASTSRWRPALPWMLAAAATLVAVMLGIRAFSRPNPPDLPTLKYTVPISESLERTGLPAISPDGRHIAFVRSGAVWIRSLDQVDARQLTGPTGAQFPFWSPDSRQVAYLTANALWRIALDGSQPVRIAGYTFTKGGRTPGGVWLADDTIVFAPSATGSGLLSVPSQGGEFVDFYERDPDVEGDFHRPAVLPDGRSLVFVVDRLDTGADTIGVLSNGTRKDILRIKGELLDSPCYSPTGHLLYHRETTTPGVWALPFSLSRLEATGPPFLVAPHASYPSVATSDLLIYAENSVSGLTTLAWVDVRTGAASRAFNEEFPEMTAPALSPDGTRVAAVVPSPDQGVVVIVADLQRHTHIRLGDRVDTLSRPTWRDDRTVIYGRSQGRRQVIVMRAADGSGPETILADGMQPRFAAGRVLYTKLGPGTAGDLFHLLLPPDAPPGPPEMLQQRREHEWEPALSPDGTLLAYSFGDVGQSEVNLQTYPKQTGQWQVSSAGGGNAVWSPHGDAIYYREPQGQIMRVAVRATPTVTLGAPTLVARPSNLIARVGFDVSADGSRLLMVEEVAPEAQRAAAVAVVQNWLAEFGQARNIGSRP
jgi:serine/threonine-protein kinase